MPDPAIVIEGDCLGSLSHASAGVVLAIDPGPESSAWVMYGAGTGRLYSHGYDANDDSLLDWIRSRRDHDEASHFAIEMIASYGMPVGKEVFETCLWIGRFIQAWGGDFTKVYRQDVKMHLCRSPRATDANVRAALIDRFGPGREKAIGTTKRRGPLYGVSGDRWAALAVAVTYADKIGAAIRPQETTR